MQLHIHTLTHMHAITHIIYNNVIFAYTHTYAQTVTVIA